MNWLKLILQLTPYVVVGVEKIHADLSGAGKRQAAQDALTIATAAALETDPGDSTTTQTASAITGLIIDSTVANLKKSGVLQSSKQAPAQQLPLPTPPAPPVVEPAPVAQADGDPASTETPVAAVAAAPAETDAPIIKEPGLHAITPA